jgi:hypothetical protein
MKGLRYSLVAAALLAGGFGTVKAQTADEIVSKYVAAIGGAENWKKVNSIKMVGSMNAGGMEFPVTVTTVKDKGFRMEFSVNGVNNYQIITPKEGWMYFPIQGQQKAEAIPAEMVKESQEELEIQDPLIDYKARGSKVAFLGKDAVEGTECYKLKLTRASGKEETMYIDASTYYQIRSVEKVKANGKEMENTTNYGNYQKLPEGIVYPMSIESPEGPITLKSVEINKPVDEKIFKPAN